MLGGVEQDWVGMDRVGWGGSGGVLAGFGHSSHKHGSHLPSSETPGLERCIKQVK